MKRMLWAFTLCGTLFLSAAFPAYALESESESFATMPELGLETLVVEEHDPAPGDSAGITDTTPDEDEQATAPDPGGVAQDMAPDEDIVYDQDGLRAWCEAHENTGGTVRLGAAVEITEHIVVYGSEPFTIATGAYGLIYNGNLISLPGLTITGEGVDIPVVEIRALSPFRMNWVHQVQDMHIAATGRDGDGGTALLLTLEDNAWPVSLNQFYMRGSVRSHGAGAVGIAVRQVQGLALYCFDVEVSGTDSVAVLATEGETTVWYSTLEATGEGASAAAGHVLLEGCAALPQYENSNNHRIVGMAGGYLPVPQGEPVAGSLLDFYAYTQFIVEDGHGAVFSLPLAVKWDSETLASIDSGVCGVTEVPGMLCPPFAGIGLDELYAPTFTVEVRDPALPCIEGIPILEKSDTDGQPVQVAMLLFWNSSYEREACVLWRSDDGGETWYDDTNNKEIEWLGPGLQFDLGNLNHSVLFQLEEKGGGFSNVIMLEMLGGAAWGAGGGDRTGADRFPGGGDTSGEGNGPDDEDANPGTPSAPDDDGDTDTPSNTGGGNKNTKDGSADGSGTNTPNTDNSGGPAADTELESTGGTPLSDGAAMADRGSNHVLEEAGDVQNTAVAPVPPQATSAWPQTEASAAVTAPTGALPRAATPQPAVPQEYEDESTIAVSGARLALLIEANPGGVVFVKQDVTVIVDASALLTLNIAEHQLFTVTVWSAAGDVRVSFALDGAALELPYTLRLPEEAALSGGETHRIRMEPPAVAGTPSTPDGVNHMAVPLFAGMGLVAGCGSAWIIRRRRTARR